MRKKLFIFVVLSLAFIVCACTNEIPPIDAYINNSNNMIV
jgi:ABC-type uncharacterized transport system auxiliary subunit